MHLASAFEFSRARFMQSFFELTSEQKLARRERRCAAGAALQQLRPTYRLQSASARKRLPSGATGVRDGA
jgi:hypothetical protein